MRPGDARAGALRHAVGVTPVTTLGDKFLVAGIDRSWGEWECAGDLCPMLSPQRGRRVEPAEQRFPTPHSEARFRLSRQPLDALCWCEAALVKVRPRDVRAGRTGSCGAPGCRPR